MQTLFTGFVEDSVIPQMKGIAIRIAYLLSTRFRMSGDVSFHFEMEGAMRTMNFAQKMKFMEGAVKDSGTPMLFFEQYRSAEKVYKKTRSRQKEFIVLQKKAETLVNTIFNAHLNDMMKQAKGSGLLTLKGLESSPSYGDYYIFYDSAESGKEGCSKLSDILQLNLDEHDNNYPTIFVLNYLFFSGGFNLGDSIKPVNNVCNFCSFKQVHVNI